MEDGSLQDSTIKIHLQPHFMHLYKWSDTLRGDNDCQYSYSGHGLMVPISSFIHLSIYPTSMESLLCAREGLSLTGRHTSSHWHLCSLTQRPLTLLLSLQPQPHPYSPDRLGNHYGSVRRNPIAHPTPRLHARGLTPLFLLFAHLKPSPSSFTSNQEHM